MGEIRIVLPFPLITWNRLLAMNQWERKKYRDWIHRAMSICIHEGIGSQIRMVSAGKLQLMGLSIADYYRMIRPSSSQRSATPKKKSAGRYRKRRRS